MNTGKIATDVYCPGCGYNLRGLASSACCPECSLPVATVWEPWDLAHADPHWIATLVGGAKLVGASLVFAALSLIATTLLAAAGWQHSLAFGTILVAGAAAGALLVGGLWRFAALSPAQARTEAPISNRRFARCCLALAAIGGLFALGAGATGAASLAPDFAIASGLAFVAGLLALAEHVARLGPPTAKGRRYARAGHYGRALAVCAALGLTLMLLGWLGVESAACLLWEVIAVGLVAAGLIMFLPLAMLDDLRAALAHSRKLRQHGANAAATPSASPDDKQAADLDP